MTSTELSLNFKTDAAEHNRELPLKFNPASPLKINLITEGDSFEVALNGRRIYGAKVPGLGAVKANPAIQVGGPATISHIEY